jgi:hypothetical protein
VTVLLNHRLLADKQLNDMCRRIQYYALTVKQHNQQGHPVFLNYSKSTVNEKSQLSTIVKLSYALSSYPASFNYMDTIKEVLCNLDILVKPVDKTGDVISEIEHACHYLRSDEIDEKDVARSSRWFRQNVSQSNASAINRAGFKKYREDHPKIDSVLVANYIKKRIASISGGLIPQALRLLLIDILQQYVDEDGLTPEVTAAVYGLLSINSQRLHLLRMIGTVANVIFDKGTVDPIKPLGLARIIKVSEDEGIDLLYANGLQSNEDTKELILELDLWNTVWGLLLAKNKLFMYQVFRLIRTSTSRH